MSETYDYKYISSLVIRARDDDADAFGELYDITHNQIHNYACSYLHDDYLAQDAVQEVYMLAFRNLDQLHDPSLFVAWIKQIAFRACFDMCKKNDRGVTDMADSDILDMISDDNYTHDPTYNTDCRLEIELLHEAIDSLPSDQRQCIVLYYYKNMKIEDIAEFVNLSRSTVKRHLVNARSNILNSIRSRESLQ